MNTISETSPSIVFRNTNDSIDANISEYIQKSWTRDVHNNIIANAVVLSLYFVIGIIGNALVLVVYKTQLRQASVERYFIPVLAISDMLSTICGSINNMAWDLMSNNFTNNALCKCFLFTISNTAYMSILLLLCIAFQRYLLICRHHSLSLKHRHLMIGLSFVFANGLALPFAFFYGVNDFYNDGILIGTRCGRLKTVLYLPGAIYAISFVSLMVLTVLTLIFFYGRIACTVFEHFKSKRSKKCSLNPLSTCSNDKYRLDIKDIVDRHSHSTNVHQENTSNICVKDKEIKIIQQSETTTCPEQIDRTKLGGDAYNIEGPCNELQSKSEISIQIDRTKLGGDAYNIEGPCNELQSKSEISIQANIIEIINDEEVFIELKKRKVIAENKRVDMESPSSEIEKESANNGTEIVNGTIIFSEILNNVENTNGASKLWIELPDFQQKSEHLTHTEANSFKTEYKIENNITEQTTIEKSNMNRDNQIQIFIEDIDDQSIDNPNANGITARNEIRKWNSNNTELEIHPNIGLNLGEDQPSDNSSGSGSRTDITNITPNETPMKKLSNNDHRNKRNRQFKNKFSMMFIVITSVSLFCYIPVGVIVLLEGVFPDFWDKLSSTEFIVVAWLYHTYIINSISNPIVYAFLDTEFYTGLKALFARFCK